MLNCILCGSQSEPFIKIPGGEMRRCPSCGLVYAVPMQLPDPPEVFFTAAYRGEVQASRMEDVGIRLKLLEHRKKFEPNDFLATGVLQELLRWVRTNVPPGGIVLDIGCGPGALLHALRRSGFRAIGVEPSIDVVEILRAEGLEVFRGTMEDIPAECPTPFAVISNLVLHHLVDPVATIAAVKARYPQAYLLVTEGNSPLTLKRRVPPEALPPRSLTWWNEDSLRLLLSKAGYEVDILQPPRRPIEYRLLPTPVVLFIYRSLKRWLPAERAWPLWIRLRRFIAWPIAAVGRVTKPTPISLLAICRPTNKLV